MSVGTVRWKRGNATHRRTLQDEENGLPLTQVLLPAGQLPDDDPHRIVEEREVVPEMSRVLGPELF